LVDVGQIIHALAVVIVVLTRLGAKLQFLLLGDGLLRDNFCEALQARGLQPCVLFGQLTNR
jgi:hypothetical protein